MFNFQKKDNIQEVAIVSLVFFSFFLIGLFSFKDFGISVDEWALRLLGFVNLKYIMQFFSYEGMTNLDKIMPIPKISEFYGNTHGAIFATPTAFIEYYFEITNSQKYYFLRHYINHFIFLIANFYFFILVKKRFDNWKYGIFGALFLFLSPRIFAESFYNHKDILFLSLFIVNLYYGITFLKSPTIKNSILFSLTAALSIDVRIMGIIIVPIILFFLFYKRLKDKKFKIYKSLLVFIILFPLLTILFWPYLWENPIANFIQIFKDLSKYSWSGYNFYLGKYVDAQNLPWHYILVWISITTPIFYIILFSYGFIKSTQKIKDRFFNISEKNNSDDLWKGNDELEDIVYYLLFIIPIVIVIVLNSTLYNGWRHLYFIYPCFLLISLKGLYLIDLNYFKKRKKILNFIVIFNLIYISAIMIKDHPHQNVYFNFIAGSNVEQKYELDYWGLSNKQAMEYILKNDKNEFVKIGSAGPISLENSKQILKNLEKKRILITENSESDYIIENYINWYGKHKKKRHQIPNNFEIYKEIYVSGKRIISIYKRI